VGCEGDVPRQELVDGTDGVLGDACQDMVEIELWVEVVELGCAE